MVSYERKVTATDVKFLTFDQFCLETDCAQVIQSSYLNPVLSDVKFPRKVLADLYSWKLLVFE